MLLRHSYLGQWRQKEQPKITRVFARSPCQTIFFSTCDIPVRQSQTKFLPER